MCAHAAQLQLLTNPKKHFKHPKETGHLSKLESINGPKTFRNDSQQVFRNDDSTAFLILFSGIVKIIFDKTVSSQNGSVLIAYMVHSVALRFSDANKQWLAQR